jgi:hypothetical protein
MQMWKGGAQMVRCSDAAKAAGVSFSMMADPGVLQVMLA